MIIRIIITLFISAIVYAQSSGVAVFNEPMSGNQTSFQSFRKAVEMLNAAGTAPEVVILGNLTRSGSVKEFDDFFKEAEKLKSGYFMLAGENDKYSGTEALYIFSEGSENNFFKVNTGNVTHIGLSTALPKLRKNGFITPESESWFRAAVSENLPEEEFIIYLNNSSGGATLNPGIVLSGISSDKIRLIVVTNDADEQYFSLLGYSVLNPVKLYESRNTGGFSLIEEKNDTLYLSVTDINSGKVSTSIIERIEKTGSGESQVALEQGTYSVLNWFKNLNQTLIAPVYSDKDYTYAVTASGDVFCFTYDSNIKWSFNTGASIISAPVRSGDVLVVTTLIGDIYTFNANNGDVLQIIGLGSTITSDPVIIDVPIFEGKRKGIVTATEDRRIICYDLFTLELLWETRAVNSLIRNKPLYFRDRIIFSSTDGNIFSVDASGGKLNWKLSGTSSADYIPFISPVSNGKYVFFTGAGNGLAAADLLLGSIAWRRNDLNVSSMTISSDGNNIFLKTTDGRFMIVSSAGGKTVTEFKTIIKNDFFPSMISQTSAGILFAQQDGNIYLVDSHGKITNIFEAYYPVHTIKEYSEGNLVISDIAGNIFSIQLNESDQQ